MRSPLRSDLRQLLIRGAILAWAASWPLVGVAPVEGQAPSAPPGVTAPQAVTDSPSDRAPQGSAGRTGIGNRLAYLDGPVDPYYVGDGFARLTTPQWIGDPRVQAVVVLAIDDMRDPDRYEAFLRPILNRLKRIDGRGALSIMTNQVDPEHPQLEPWLKEGVSLEVHTVDHPCPLLNASDFGQARRTFDQCVDRMSRIPGNHPVAFRMPCCDSMNSPSPRFYEEIFAQVTELGNFLTIDSSVFNLTTSADVELSDELVRDAEGRPRFEKYLPFPAFVNTIRNYPYPYVVGGVCWEFPCIVPSDWEAQNIQRPNNPQTVTDLKAALDVVVQKQGVLNLVFHPHGWIRNDQVVELIDHATTRYPGQVMFLNFREAQQRLDENLLGGTPLRDAQGREQGVRMLDVDDDGHLDFVRFAPGELTTRIWRPATAQWQVIRQELDAPRCQFGVLDAMGRASLMAETSTGLQAFTFDGQQWAAVRIELPTEQLPAAWRDIGQVPAEGVVIRLRDLDLDGICELILQRGEPSLILRLDQGRWIPLEAGLPAGVRLATAEGGDAGLRWVDLDGDQRPECVFSDPQGYSVDRFVSPQEGWVRILAGRRGAAPPGSVEIPPFVRPDGSNNGSWAHSQHLWWQNEDTARLDDKVMRLAFADILKGGDPVPPDNASVFPGPVEPREAIATFQSSVQARIQLVAAEPLVTDPIAFDWGPDGRLWVAEMRDYPEAEGDEHPLRGRIKVLLDENQDGVYDRAEIFLDGLHYPTGVKVWRDGVLISGAPRLIYAEDTDGDLRADRQRVLYEGFGEGNQQHRINGLRWGIDAWLYLANGDSGGRIRSFAHEDSLEIGGRDLRIQPDTGRMEAVAGPTQYGRCRDDLGNWFGGNNSDPLWHYVLDEHYLRRNPHFAPPSLRRQVPSVPGPAPIFPVSKTLPRFNDFDRADRFTSACGPLVVQNEGAACLDFGPAGSVDTYVCEPVHNLIHRERMVSEGGSFRSTRLPADESAEFLASTDNWFRPVMVRIGPDGALWVADMYRLVIEHPEWIPQHWQTQLDLRAGHDRGRIYRLSPPDQASPAGLPRLDHLATEALVERLDHPSRWQRDMAQQMILWRTTGAGLEPAAEAAPIDPLRKLVAQAQRPVAKMQALYTLQALGGLEAGWLAELIRREIPAVARHAIVVGESFLEEGGDDHGLLESMLSRLDTPDPALQRQLAYSLGQSRDDRAAAALGQLARQSAKDPTLQAAVISSLTPSSVPTVLQIVADSPDAASGDLLRELLSQSIAQGDLPARTLAMQLLAAPRAGWPTAWRLETLAGVLDDYLRSPASLGDLPASVRDQLAEGLASARQLVVDPSAPVGLRGAAVSLLRGDLGELSDSRENREVLAKLLDPKQPPDLQTAAAVALLRTFPEQAIEQLMPNWNGFSPRMRDRLLDDILRRRELILAMLGFAERQQLDLQLDARRRQRLLQNSDSAIVEAARRVLVDDQAASRDEVIARYHPGDQLTGDPDRGRQAFQRTCAACHEFAGMGHAVGPNLAALSNKSVDFLLTSILDPNRAVEANYLDYQVEAVDGRLFSGILVAETASAVTLLATDGKQQPILREQIEFIRSTGRSLMPEGLEKDLTPAQLQDILVFLRSYQPERKRFEGNRPEVAPRRDDGSIRLLAMHAEIYGPSLVFEPQYRNLGFWGSPQDYAVWTIEVPAAGRFSVTLDYACPHDSAGNRFVLGCGDQQLSGEIQGTESWDEYRWRSIGILELPAGTSRVFLRADGPLKNYLLDLHQIVLSPTRRSD